MSGYKLLEQERTYTRILLNLLALVFGVAVYAAGHLELVDVKLRDPAKNLGEAIAGASIVFFLFNQAAERLLIVLVRNHLGTYLGDTIQGLLKPTALRLDQDGITDYRWHCWISGTRPTDNYPSYVYQTISISYHVRDLPDNPYLVIGFSNEDTAVSKYFDDPACLTRWPMSFLDSEPLDLLNVDSHAIHYFKINGVDQPSLRKCAVSLPGGRAVEYRYKFRAANAPGNQVHVSFSFTVRKIASADGLINVITRLFREANFAEFGLSIDPGIGARSLNIYTAEATPWVDDPRLISKGQAALPDGTVIGGFARFMLTLQKGSNVRFEVRKN